ncbi:MAG: hypothetical protein ACXWG8_09715, partial [Usitatibacter sp.]
TPAPVTVKHSHQADGLHFIYFYVAVVTQPGEAPVSVSTRIAIINNIQKSQYPDVAANVILARLRDISPNASTKLHVLPPGTKGADAEKWIHTPEGQSWAKGTVGGSLCQIVLAIPK